MNEIKPYPEKPPEAPKNYGGLFVNSYWASYERALAEAYRSRLVVAVEALKQLADDARKAPDNDSAVSDPIRWSMEVYARRMIAAIGSLE